MRAFSKPLPWISVMSMVWLLVGVSAGAEAASAPVPVGARRVAVQLRYLGSVERNVGASLYGFLSAEVGKLPGVVLVKLKPAESAAATACNGDLACLVGLGRKVKADEIVSGVLSGVEEGYSLHLRHIVVSPGMEKGSVTAGFPGNKESLIDGVRAAAYQLLAPEKYLGSIGIDLEEPGAEAFLDGQALGTTPFKEPVGDLTPGRHALKIRKQGFDDYDNYVDIRFDRVSVVQVKLRSNVTNGELSAREAPELVPLVPPLPLTEVRQTRPLRWPGYAALIAGGVFMVGGAVEEIRAASLRREARGYLEADRKVVPYDQREQAKRKVDAYSTARNVGDSLLVAGTAALLGGGAYLYFMPGRSGANVGVSGKF